MLCGDPPPNMITSIFSPFDSTLLSESTLPLYILIAAYPFVGGLSSFWNTPNSEYNYLSLIISNITDLLKPTSGWYIKGIFLVFPPVIRLILRINTWGNLPYIFPLSSQLNFTLRLGFIIWGAIIICSISANIKSATSHFLPENTPLIISPFLSLVETLRSYIRPITLSFRLAANIRAGHIILGIICSASPTLFFINPKIILFPTILRIGYLTFEFIICGVQAFVFILLRRIYTSDYIHNK